MTKYLLFALSLCAICACEGKSKKMQQERLQAQQDSIERQKTDSTLRKQLQLAEIAYGDAKFGMTQAKVLKTKICKDATIAPYGIYLDLDQAWIGDVHYWIEFYFYNNLLYQAYFENGPISDHKYNTVLKKELEALKDIISVNYGEPESFGFPEMQTLNKEKPTCVYAWRCMTKAIQIGVQEAWGEPPYNYYIIMLISDISMIETLQSVDQHVQKKKKLDDAQKF